MEGATLTKITFRDQLKLNLSCKISDEELSALMVNFDKDGLVDGSKFSLFFRRIRFEYKSKLKSDLLAHNRRAEETRKADELALKVEAEKKMTKIFPSEFTEIDKRNVLNKIKEAAYRYDRLMPGAVQLDAFEEKCMTPYVFRDQLRRVFNMQLSPEEVAALIRLALSNFLNRLVLNAYSIIQHSR